MTKRMLIMLICVGLLFGAIFGFQMFRSAMIKRAMSSQKAPPVVVTAMKAEFHDWQPKIKAVGSLRAVRGVDVTTEIAGLVRELRFRSGQDVDRGQLLVQLNADSDIAQLHSLEAAAELAKTVYERDKKQYDVQAVSQATLDADAADLKSKLALVAQQLALVEKKTIVAPFSGRLGISTVNPGQYLNPGDKIVTLQSLDRLYADFYLPQQELSRISAGQKVVLTSDSYSGKTFPGKITTVNPKVDPDTRNFQVEATIPNPGRMLLPGMYATVEVLAGGTQRYLTLPQTAVTYNPYGETVYIVEESGKEAGGKPVLKAKQTFVTVGGSRGDQVAILKGLKEGDLVITSGQVKLRSGSTVIINNKVQPSNEIAPKPVEE